MSIISSRTLIELACFLSWCGRVLMACCLSGVPHLCRAWRAACSQEASVHPPLPGSPFPLQHNQLQLFFLISYRLLHFLQHIQETDLHLELSKTMPEKCVYAREEKFVSGCENINLPRKREVRVTKCRRDTIWQQSWCKRQRDRTINNSFTKTNCSVTFIS